MLLKKQILYINKKEIFEKLLEAFPFLGGSGLKFNFTRTIKYLISFNISELTKGSKEDLPAEDTPKPKKPGLLSRIFGRKKTDASDPLAHPPAAPLTEEQSISSKEAIKEMSSEEQFLHFFSNSPFWTVEAPKVSFLGRLFSFLKTKEVSYVKCVFVSRTSEPKYGYFPYNSKDKYLFFPDGRIYGIPQDGDTWFFDADRHLPLIHAREPGDIYDLPTHYATAIHNDGVQYGKVSAYKDLVETINSVKVLTTILAILTGATVLICYLLVRQVSGDYSTLAAEVHTLQSILGGAT